MKNRSAEKDLRMHLMFATDDLANLRYAPELALYYCDHGGRAPGTTTGRRHDVFAQFPVHEGSRWPLPCAHQPVTPGERSDSHDNSCSPAGGSTLWLTADRVNLGPERGTGPLQAPVFRALIALETVSREAQMTSY